MSNDTLRSRIRCTAVLTTFGYAIGQLIRFAGNLVMARLLAPESFGLMAIAWAVMSGLTMVSDAGLRQCIVQSRRGDDPVFLDTAWVIQVVRGVLLTFIALIFAGSFAFGGSHKWFSDSSVYSHPGLPGILSVVAFTAFISGLETTKFSTANRNLALSGVVAIELSSQLVGLCVMVAWAQIDRSVLALAIGGIASGAVRAILGHTLLPGHSNRWKFDSESATEILKFGKWIFLSSTLGFAAINGDKLVLGAVINAELLGQYALAALMAGAIQQVFSKTIANVVLPVLSETARERPTALKDAYYRLRLPIDLITLFLTGILYVLATWITSIFYDGRYQLAGLVFQILIVLLIETRYETAIQCYLALGKSKYISPIMTVRLLPLFLVAPWVCRSYGLLAACWVIVLSSLLTIPAHIYFLWRCKVLDIKRELLVLPMGLLGFACGNALLKLFSWNS